MKTILPLTIGISILLIGCNSTLIYRKVSESEIPEYKSKLSLNELIQYKSNWKQPENKSEPCEMLMERYAPVSVESQSYSITWDGECEGGKASGLGKVVANLGAVESYEIGYVKGGISEQYYYSGVKGANIVKYGLYIREGNNSVKTLDNYAVTKSDGEIDYVYLSVETDKTTGIALGSNYRKYNDGTATQIGYFGNGYFFGNRQNFDTNSTNTANLWGFFNTNTDKPDNYVVLKNNQGTWHQLFEYGSAKETVQLPEKYLNTLMRVTEEGAQATNKVRQSGQYALAMKKKYDAQTVAPTKNIPDEPQPETSKGIATGTGFFISNDGYVLTNSHVIEGSSNISIILNGKSVSATLVDHDPSNDIALLKVEEAVEGLPIELKTKTKQGTEIAVLGYPNIGLQGNEQKATFGYINANSGIQGDTRYFQISSPIQPGNSGSPMVTNQGVVIGIASASLNQSAAIRATGTLAQNVNYAVKIAYALPMLINHGVDFIEPAKQKSLEKTELIESISNSVVLVIAE
ncbi:serine protease [Thalassotalea ponticola]|uniref:S1C family serine protease n=1 Tax=Thalassotalea ponticola TaxID=1523392 RepID=UPI0025B2EF01|nr:serine protease [Thalassotalea ponticola]MDN3653603.1 serine protease [Thalassotalea ponticola]